MLEKLKAIKFRPYFDFQNVLLLNPQSISKVSSPPPDWQPIQMVHRENSYSNTVHLVLPIREQWRPKHYMQRLVSAEKKREIFNEGKK